LRICLPPQFGIHVKYADIFLAWMSLAWINRISKEKIPKIQSWHKILGDVENAIVNIPTVIFFPNGKFVRILCLLKHFREMQLFRNNFGTQIFQGSGLLRLFEVK
jgi:hypothetical protein